MNLLLFQHATFVFFILFCTVVDYLIPSRYKLQAELKKTHKYNYKEMIEYTCFNIYILTFPLGYLFLQIYEIYNLVEFVPSTYLEYIFQGIRLLFCILLEEILFYYIHRILHFPFFYSSIHKKHHQLIAPIALGTLYVDPWDHLFLNLLPILITPLLTRVRGPFLYIWFLLANISSVFSHCGFSFFGKGVVIHHDNHHKYRTCNYGVIGLLDYLHGTLKL